MPGMENAHALVIGIADYWHPNRYLGKLPPTVCQDARDIHALLVDPQRGGYPVEQTRLLLDGQASLTGLRHALADLAARCDADSIAFLYISSHGGTVESGPDAGEYLLPVDVVCTEEGRLQADTALSGAEFTTALQAIPARKVLVIFDCCHAGGIGEIKGGVTPQMKAGLPESYYETLKAGRGRVIIASSRSTEASWLLPGDANSLFTKHLLAGLAGGIPSPDGFVRVFDIFEYLQPRVTGEQPQQHPIFQSKIEENFPVVLALGGQKSSVPQDTEGFRYDAYITFATVEPDASWVWGTLVPRLRDAGLRIAVSSDVEEPGSALVIGIERAIEQSKRTIAVISRAYLADAWTGFQEVVATHLGIQERQARVLPLVFDPTLMASDGRGLSREVALHLGILVPLDMNNRYTDPFAKLVNTLKSPLPPLFGR
jgi:hypothetical protein